MRNPVSSRLAVLLVALLLLPSCAGLRDREGFVAPTVTLSEDPETGELVIDPARVTGDWSYGQVQINNTTGQNHGFAIDELAIYETIPQQTSPIIRISDAQDDTTYVFYCHLHDVNGVPAGTEYRGELVIDYSEEAPI